MGLITLCTFSTTDSSTGSKIRQPTVRVRTKPPSSTLFPKCAAASDKHRDISYPSLETAHVRLNTAASRCYNHNHSSLETARVRLNIQWQYLLYRCLASVGNCKTTARLTLFTVVWTAFSMQQALRTPGNRRSALRNLAALYQVQMAPSCQWNHGLLGIQYLGLSDVFGGLGRAPRLLA